jgi:acyl-CoA reductase-like NAD-dependent aldehyde dehydrogenase
MVVGDGLAPAVTTGPMHSRAQLERGLGFVDDARRRGAKVDLVGSIQDPEVFREGYFMQPSIVTNIEPTAPLVVEEQFCASIPIITYRDLDDAIAQANDSVFGLGGSVWGRDVDRALDVAKKVAAGTVWVNTHGIPYINRRAPYGGVKQSGIGRKSGLEGILDYMQSQTISTWEPR